MKISRRKKNDRKDFIRKGKKCPNCGEDISSSGHFVPALNLWTCDSHENNTPVVSHGTGRHRDGCGKPAASEASAPSESSACADQTEGTKASGSEIACIHPHNGGSDELTKGGYRLLKGVTGIRHMVWMGGV